MFDETTFNGRHGESHTDVSDDPVVQMLAERERLYALAGRARTAAEEIEWALPEDVRRHKVMVQIATGLSSPSYQSESELKVWLAIVRELRFVMAQAGAHRVEEDTFFETEIAGPALEQFRVAAAKIAEMREASGCEALLTGKVRKSRVRLHNRIVEMQATSLTGASSAN